MTTSDKLELLEPAAEEAKERCKELEDKLAEVEKEK